MNLVSDIILPLRPNSSFSRWLSNVNTVEDVWKTANNPNWLVWLLLALAPTANKKAVLINGFMPLVSSYLSRPECTSSCGAQLQKQLEDFVLDKTRVPAQDTAYMEVCIKERVSGDAIHTVILLNALVAAVATESPATAANNMVFALTTLEKSKTNALAKLSATVSDTLWHDVYSTP